MIVRSKYNVRGYDSRLVTRSLSDIPSDPRRPLGHILRRYLSLSSYTARISSKLPLPIPKGTGNEFEQDRHANTPGPIAPSHSVP